MDIFNIRPFGSMVIIKPIIEDQIVFSNVIMLDTSKDKLAKGIVTAVGKVSITNDGNLQRPRVKLKDIVIFSSDAGTDIKIMGEKYLIMHENEIYGIVIKTNNKEHKMSVKKIDSSNKVREKTVCKIFRNEMEDQYKKGKSKWISDY